MMFRLLLLAPRGALAFGLPVLLVACATQREQRISSAEARDRPSAEACQPKGQPPRSGWLWACGYWHWDAVRYVWIPGEWRGP